MAERSNVLTTSQLLGKRTTRLGKLRNCAALAWWRLNELPPSVRLLFGLTLLVLLGLLAGCGTLSVPPSVEARNPQPPQISEPLPSESYLSKAQKLIENWRNAVTGM
jgi:hypothetical protein